MFSHKDNTLANFKVKTRREAIDRHLDYCLANPWFVKQIIEELDGKILGCWCKPKSCHGDNYIFILENRNLFL